MERKHPVSVTQSRSQPHFRFSGRTRAWIVAIGAALLAVLVFSPLLKAPFLFDDHTVIESDSAIVEAAIRDGDDARNVSLLQDLWRKPRPLRQLSHRLDWCLVGDNAAFPHAVNMLLHLAVAGMGWLLLRRRCGASAAVATSATLLFLLNPVVVESVGIVSHRKEMLGAFFVLLGLFFALRNPSRVSWLAVVCFFLAAAGKETSLVFPALFAILAWGMRIGRTASGDGEGGSTDGADRRRVRSFAAYAAFALLFAVIFWWQIHASMDFAGGIPGEQEARAGHFTMGVAWAQAFSAAIRAFPRNLLLLLIPFWHAPDPVIALHVSLFSAETICSFVAGCLGLVLLAMLVRERNPVSVPLLWMCAALVPYLFPGLLRIGATAVLADRYLYLASFGFAWAAAIWISRLPALFSRGAVAALVLIYGIFSFSLCLNYLDEAEYWAFASRQNPSSVLAAHNHAWGLWKEHEDFIGARLEFRRMLRLAPDFDYGICSYAQMHAEENDPESAMNLLDSALRRMPESMHLNRQRALLGSLFDDDEARTLKCFRKAAALGADDGSFHFGWAEYLKELLDWKNAAREFRIAGERNPFFSEEAREARFLLQNPPIKPGGRILVIGDSVPHGTGTKGEGDNEERSLAVAMCELFLNASDNLVVDVSVPGSLAGDLEEQLDQAVESGSGGSRPFSLCIVLSGHNDAFADASSFEILGCLAETALECRRRGIVPVLVGPIHVRDEPERPRNRQEKVLSALDRKLASFCAAAGITYVSAREALGSNDLSLPTGANYDKNSGNHLSRTGIGKLAETVRAAIRPLWIEELKSP